VPNGTAPRHDRAVASHPDRSQAQDAGDAPVASGRASDWSHAASGDSGTTPGGVAVSWPAVIADLDVPDLDEAARAYLDELASRLPGFQPVDAPAPDDNTPGTPGDETGPAWTGERAWRRIVNDSDHEFRVRYGAALWLQHHIAAYHLMQGHGAVENSAVGGTTE